jgi:hypothetical protein
MTDREEVARVFVAMERDLGVWLALWSRRLQDAGWTEVFGLSVEEGIRDDLYYAALECPETGGHDLADAIERESLKEKPTP